MLRSALLYFSLVFAAGTILGTMRTLLLVPHVGAFAAVLIEIPVMLALSWQALKLALWLRPVATGLPRIGMGVLAFTFLMGAEFLLARQLADMDLASFVQSLGSAEGLAGLGAQIVFALLPLIQGWLQQTGKREDSL